MKERVKLEVYVDLDPTPGTFHSVDSARNTVMNVLIQNLGQYRPVVSVGKEEERVHRLDGQHVILKTDDESERFE